MTLRLRSIEQAPVSLPLWHVIMDDLGKPPVRRVARVLGVSQRTVYRYNRTGRAPRAVLLALFWLTRWGQSAVNAQAVNDATLAVTYVDSLRRQVVHLERQLRYVARLSPPSSANDPLLALPPDRPPSCQAALGDRDQHDNTGRGGWGEAPPCDPVAVRGPGDEA